MENELKILILEDNPDDADLMKVLLRRAGILFESVVAANEQELLNALNGDGFHAVLADNALPQYSSTEALRLVRKRNPHAAFILVTGTVSEEFAVKIIKEGADDYLLKSNLTRLPTALTNAVRKKKMEYGKEKAEREIERERVLSISIMNSLPGIFYLCDRQGKFLRWNENFETISGYTANEISAMSMDSFFIGDERDHMQLFMEQSFANGEGDTESIFITKNMQRIPYYIKCKAVNFENRNCLISVGLDISASKQSEQKLLHLNEELHHVSGHLERIREEEQARIAREVHDQVGQQLTGLKMDLWWLKDKVHKNLSAEALLEKMEEMSKMLDEAVVTVRKVASDLRPSILDDFGLGEALEWHSKEFTRRSGIQVDFHMPPQKRDIDPAVSIGLFRIYQEVLTNVARHAEAKTVDAYLEFQPGQLLLSIRDDGKGFDSSQPRKSLGLLGMRERAYILGGELLINSKPGAGTNVTITVPMNLEE